MRGHHSQETRDLMRRRNLAFWTPEKRVEQSQRIRVRMRRPGVSERISAGMRRAVEKHDNAGH